jgi:flagellar hook-length control protein FliK
VSTTTPDPTTLTTEALRRDIGALQNVMEAKLKCLEEILNLRIEAVNKLKETKFEWVNLEFEARERVRLEQKADTKDRVDAALSAQKEAAHKAEQSFTKQIDSLRDLMTSHGKTSDDKIAALDRRVTSNEGRAMGAGSLWGIILGAVGLLGVVFSILHK